MNYRHIFHAGGFADVFKHCILITLLEAMQRKEKPYFYLETHAGCGGYEHSLLATQKIREYEQGIERIAMMATQKNNQNVNIEMNKNQNKSQNEKLPTIVENYFNIVKYF